MCEVRTQCHFPTRPSRATHHIGFMEILLRHKTLAAAFVFFIAWLLLSQAQSLVESIQRTRCGMRRGACRCVRDLSWRRVRDRACIGTCGNWQRDYMGVEHVGVRVGAGGCPWVEGHVMVVKKSLSHSRVYARIVMVVTCAHDDVQCACACDPPRPTTPSPIPKHSTRTLACGCLCM